MPPENLMQFLQQLMTPAAPDATGFAHDEINKLIHKKKEIEPSLRDFIRANISTVEGLKPEDTSYGRAIAQIVEEHGSPYIMPTHVRKGKTPIITTQSYKDYVKEVYGTTLSDTTWMPYTSYKHAIPAHTYDKRELAGDRYPAVDTVSVPFGEDFTYPDKKSYTSIRLLLEELAHTKQWQGSKGFRKFQSDRMLEEKSKFDDPHETPGTLEWEAHKEMYPEIRKRFETLLDSLSQPFTLESLFQNQ